MGYLLFTTLFARGTHEHDGTRVDAILANGRRSLAETSRVLANARRALQRRDQFSQMRGESLTNARFSLQIQGQLTRIQGKRSKWQASPSTWQRLPSSCKAWLGHAVIFLRAAALWSAVARNRFG